MGSKAIKFALLGETVETAAQLAATGVPMALHVSDDVRVADGVALGDGVCVGLAVGVTTAPGGMTTPRYAVLAAAVAIVTHAVVTVSYEYRTLPLVAVSVTYSTKLPFEATRPVSPRAPSVPCSATYELVQLLDAFVSLYSPPPLDFARSSATLEARDGAAMLRGWGRHA